MLSKFKICLFTYGVWTNLEWRYYFFFLVKKNGGIIKEGDLKNYNFNYGNLLRKMDSF